MKQLTPHLKIATNDDILQILELLEKLHRASVYSKYGVFIASDVQKLVRNLLSKPQSDGCIILLYTDKAVGLLACSYMYQLFNQSHKSAVELAFWIEPEYRTISNTKKLLGAYKYWASSTGCATMLIGKLQDKDTTETYSIRRLT